MSQRKTPRRWNGTTSSIDLEVLLLRPEPFEDESLLGYLSRLAAANFLKGIYHLADLTEIDLPVLRGFTATWEKEARQIVLKRVRTLDSVYPAALPVRICPLCFDQRPYIRASWDMPLSVRCNVHDCLLHDKCPGCGTLTSHQRPHFGRCQCGKTFSSFQVLEVPEWVFLLERNYIDHVRPAQLGFKNCISLAELDACRHLQQFTGMHKTGRIKTLRRHTYFLRSEHYSDLEQLFLEDACAIPRALKNFIDSRPPHRSILPVLLETAHGPLVQSLEQILHEKAVEQVLAHCFSHEFEKQNQTKLAIGSSQQLLAHISTRSSLLPRNKRSTEPLIDFMSDAIKYERNSRLRDVVRRVESGHMQIYRTVAVPRSLADLVIGT